MERREFLVWSGSALAGASAGALTGCAVGPTSVPGSLYDRLIDQNDASVASLLARQTVVEPMPSIRGVPSVVGGVPDRHGIHHPGGAAGLVLTMAVAFDASASRYHRSGELVRRMEMALRFLLRMQHEDGTLDLMTTNFHSPPDTGFVLEWIAAATGLLRRQHRAELAPLLRALERFVRRAAGALAVGGIHTPNHRWVVCMALARVHALFPDDRYVERIDQWLHEGIDLDADGQYTERSTSIYSPLTDRCLITVARLLDRPALYEPVRRNLEMTLYYLHADGEIATEGSRRQDQFRRATALRYHYPYRYMALRDGNGRFAAAARFLAATEAHRLTRDAVFFAESEALRAPLPANAPLPTDYEKWFKHSHLTRIRRGECSATILADNATFLSFHKGSAAMVVRLASAFFGKGQFTGAALTKRGAKWVLAQALRGPYWQTLRPEQWTGENDWARVVRETRQASEVQDLQSVVTVHEVGGGFELGFDIRGTARVPFAIELAFRHGGSLAGRELERVSGVDDAWTLRGGQGRYTFGEDTITFDGGLREHTWTQLRGALPKLDADCVYLTGFTPFRGTLRVR